MWPTMGGVVIRALGVAYFEKFMLSFRDVFLETKRVPAHSASCSVYYPLSEDWDIDQGNRSR